MKCQEPYLYIDGSNQLRLLVPLTQGAFIGTDNTCKTTEALKDFFGASIYEEGQAVKYLQDFINDLQNSRSNKFNNKLKKQLIRQAKGYMNQVES